MLADEELFDTAEAFGVTEQQVRRDHFISHVLWAIGTLGARITFFGGTALARTHVADPAHGARLSEDIDLLTPTRRATADLLSAELPLLVRREFPNSTWSPPLTAVRSTDPAHLVSAEGIRVRIQLLDTTRHAELGRWPTERRDIALRYSDLQPIELEVPRARHSRP